MFKPSFLINHEELKAITLGDEGKIKSIDGMDLSYQAYLTDHPRCCILFYHGGGANNLNYTKMAESLCHDSQIATFIFDMRGHGKSEGLRGYSPAKELIWSDISSAIQFLRKHYPGVSIYLGGHSSGAGLV